MNISVHSPRNEDIVVSLTSFPERIDVVWMVINCIKRQTLLPGKILLWLSREQFMNKDSLPNNLKNLEDGLFEIRLVDGDIRSHKKYHYVSKEFSSKLIVLIDDDIFYPPSMIEDLFCSYKKREGEVICRYGYTIKRNSEGGLMPYNSWPMLFDEAEGNDVFFGSGGGTLYCPNLFDDELLNINKAIVLTPIADDIWLNAMARYSHLKIKMLKHGSFLPIEIKTNQSLYKMNQGENLNDVQLQNVIDYYNAKNFNFK